VKHVDMSPAAVAARLAEVSALNRLCASLGEAGSTLARTSKVPSGEDYERLLSEFLDLPAVATACARAPRALQLVLQPAFDPECCVLALDSGTSVTLEIRALNRSTWGHLLAKSASPGAEPLRSWVAPSLSTERIVASDRTFDALDVRDPVTAGDGARAVVLDGMRFAFTRWRGGVSEHIQGNVLSLPGLPPAARLLIDAARSVAQWQRSRECLDALARYLG
jgi:hypothetical protein